MMLVVRMHICGSWRQFLRLQREEGIFPYLKEEEKTLEAMALVEMLVKRMLMVGSRVGTFTLKASGSSCRSATDASVTF